jgi:hypothetical protein
MIAGGVHIAVSIASRHVGVVNAIRLGTITTHWANRLGQLERISGGLGHPKSLDLDPRRLRGGSVLVRMADPAMAF